MTKKTLSNYRKLKKEIPLLEYELAELKITDKGIGNSVILNGKNGSKKPESVIGFDEKKYLRRKAALMKKREETAAVEEWIDGIEDVQTRCVFKMYIPRQKITTDTTEFKYYEVDSKGHMTMHKLYLDPFMDMCNGEILSFGIDKHPSAENVLVALEKAIKITSDCPYRRTFHSDQGWAYQMKAYSRRLKEERIFQSMSRKGNCHDNSVMENFFGLLKQEIYYGVVYYSFEELKSEIERYIKYYNEQRIKEKLGWMSPVQYRLSLLAA